MKFLNDVSVSNGQFGYELIIRLKGEWREAAQAFPSERIPGLWTPEKALAQTLLDETDMKQQIELRTGEYGLHHISFVPDRAGLDLFTAQDSYISHNISRASQVAAAQIIITRYLRDLEFFLSKPSQSSTQHPS